MTNPPLSSSKPNEFHAQEPKIENLPQEPQQLPKDKMEK